MSRSLGLSETVEHYVRAMNREEHPGLARCRTETETQTDNPAMQISPEQAAFMSFLARMLGAKTYIDIGVFTGYSALALALTLKDICGDAAKVIACDISDEHLAKARSYWSEAKVETMIDFRLGPAQETLSALQDGSADMIFVDADKPGYPAYYEAGARLLRPGGVMLFDNVLWDGDVADKAKSDEDIDALRQVANIAKDDKRFDIAFTNIGDGLLLCRKR